MLVKFLKSHARSLDGINVEKFPRGSTVNLEDEEAEAWIDRDICQEIDEDEDLDPNGDPDGDPDYDEDDDE